ncbi:M23 family metallopeptidase [Pseudonocardia sp. S2-4]|uniref:M23 family metallopeptidase n=2 Tax=Pseudonocardia humida TaxID=2800819 RepID=A0ABT0ZUG6_9PSEU|nr:M23 family metallopeptidase [Pseudonocardia humida]
MRTCLLTEPEPAPVPPERPPPPEPPGPPGPDRRRARAAAVLACLAVVAVCAAAAALPAGAPAPAPAATTPGPPVRPAQPGPTPPPPPSPDADARGTPPAPGPAPGARYGWPLHPVPAVRTPFRPPAHPYGPGHRGVDLAGAPGAEVLAARAGTVVFAGPVGGPGVVSVLHDDGLRTTYQPVRPLVATGAAVAAGQPVGRLDPGHAGCPDPACLHWGVRRGPGEYLDPLVLLRPPRVRLLPVPEPWPVREL